MKQLTREKALENALKDMVLAHDDKNRQDVDDWWQQQWEDLGPCTAKHIRQTMIERARWLLLMP